MTKIFIVILVVLATLCFSQTDIFSKYYSESRKIAEAMTLNQKIGQMIQADLKSITN
jgi:cytochrome c oxidase assembly factor CtaG